MDGVNDNTEIERDNSDIDYEKKYYWLKEQFLEAQKVIQQSLDDRREFVSQVDRLEAEKSFLLDKVVSMQQTISSLRLKLTHLKGAPVEVEEKPKESVKMEAAE
ncbi:hypothetical protein PCE1_001297 [Barthelona sp. PCE]